MTCICCWWLRLQRPATSVTYFTGLAGLGAINLSAGALHPFLGPVGLALGKIRIDVCAVSQAEGEIVGDSKRMYEPSSSISSAYTLEN